ncbi:hypothetical protein SPRG_05371 [Saprolegnia parasitica CBS 223.65]|uniref:MYND-type domain-containing protein n=1 Tax=Saprolegnia parasitica (strain CBS 223.65) TaxID=695850 RepID=A0A067CHK0_SAPPC|nr:hypothetical protein SPRG_05371 [Saprolegnia parasitica CBS 223.65]KDO30179.1 hypothetical protein SPRG_05371 [Saprolegnia parasitica CBS 223.65]|eukprot:XP_012199357.1 hypothetical protein SPRG_05371 [Saprolegnia parasitica CBS 223.65]
MSAQAKDLLAAARCGDVDDVKQLCMSISADDLNYQDEYSGNTALHMACANGHIGCVKLLLAKHPRLLPNLNGNSPLHWAVQNKHIDVVKLLIAAYPDIDVLAQNAFGRGCVTEAFQSENTDIVALLLEHKSATEERLANNADLANGAAKLTLEDDDEDVASEAEMKKQPRVLQETTLEFAFDATLPALKARELALDMDKSAFGSSADEDITGVSIWSASLILSRWVLQDAASFANKRVCELGAGCGVSGLACYLYTSAASVVLTDLYHHTVANLDHNAKLNKPTKAAIAETSPEAVGCAECGTLQRFTADNPEGKLMLCGRCRCVAYCSRECQKAAWKLHKGVCKELLAQKTNAAPTTLSVRAVDWAKPETYGSDVFDVVLGSDLVYHKDIVPILAQVVDAVLVPGGRFLHVASQARDSLVEFKDAMETRGFRVSMTIVPDALKTNPLVGSSADLFDLHFNEMSDTYCMYTFTKAA